MMLGGLVVWAVHFLGVYALVSAADISADPGHAGWRWAVGGFSLLCLTAIALLSTWAWRDLNARTPDDRFAPGIALSAGGVAALGVAFQTLPAVFG